MLDRGNIIEHAFLKVGDPGQIYSDNRTERYNIAEKLLDNILDTVALDTAFLFNAVTVNLTKNANSTNEFDEYRYNRPNDFLSIIRYSDNMRIEGEFIYSTNEALNIMYCRKIVLEKFPDYMKNYLVLKLAVELCFTYTAYENKIQLILAALNSEKVKVMNNEGLVINNVSGG